MSKRQATGLKTARKKKKGNATFSFTSPDDDEPVTEDVRVWNVSSSKNTGRTNATRTTLKNLRQAPTEIPPICDESGVDEMTVDIDAGILADSESPPGKRSKQKRTRARKENDSVSEVLISPHSPGLLVFPDKD